MAVTGEAPSAERAVLPASVRKRWRRWRPWRWLGLVGAALLALFGLLLGLLVLVGQHLDHPWIKPRLLALVRESGGLDVDYSGLEVSLFHGVRARSLSILTPRSLAAGSEKFLHVADLELDVRLWRLPFGEPHVELLHVGALELAIVVDPSGRTTLSELFPPQPEPQPEAPARLSQSLTRLPPASLERLEIGEIRARWVELGSTPGGAALAAPGRHVALGGFGVDGTIRSGERGLDGTQLSVRSGPSMRLELRTEHELRHAVLELELAARGAGADTLALDGHLGLLDQDLAPGWPRTARLFALGSRLRFDAAASRTELSLTRLEALGRALSLEGSAEVSDGGARRVVATGTARVHLGEWPPAGLPRSSLPAALASLALGSLDLEANADALSWDDAGAGGSASFNTTLEGFAFDDGPMNARSKTLAASGSVALSGRGGRFEAKLTGSPAWRAPPLTAELGELGVALQGNVTQAGATQVLDGEATLTLGSAHVVGEAGEALELSGVTSKSRWLGSLAELPERVLPMFETSLAIARLTAAGGGRRVEARELKTSASLHRVAPDPTSPTGFGGDAELSLSGASLDVFEPIRRGRKQERNVLAARGSEARVVLPLSLERLEAELGAEALRAPGNSLAKLKLGIDAQSPLAWAPGSTGEAHASLRGTLGRAQIGDSRGALEALHVSARRLAGDRYQIELSAVAASLVGRGRSIPGRVNAELRARAALPEGTLAVNAALFGGPAAPAAAADLEARFERGSGRVVYRGGLTGERLGSLARLVTGAAPSAAQVSLVASRLRLSARGALSGLLRAGPGPLPVVSQQPLRDLSGDQAARLELSGLDYHAPDLSLAVPNVVCDVESVHRAGGAGSAKLRWSAQALSYEGGGAALRLEGLEHRLSTTFERATEEGAADIHSTFELAAATQSWVPSYPVRDLRLVSDTRLEGLSVFVRELSFDNPAGGTSLRASGALELLAENAVAGSGSQTLAGREALSLDGRLQQDLGPLDAAGATARSSGTLTLPFRVESGGLLGYRLLATLEAKAVTFATHDASIAVDELNGVIPIVEEIALLPGGLVMGVSPRSSPLSDARFFDVHPFLAGNNYVTARSIRAAGMPAFGPLAANVRLERTGLSIDQLQVGYSGGQIVGQARFAYRDGDPVVRLRLNATGLRTTRSDDVFDANATLSFEPVTLTLDGKLQIVRASSGHVLDMLDLIDPYRESTNANRVRSALAIGYPKFVRFKLHDGTVDAKVELGGLAQLVRLDEIKAIPIGPALQRYVAPAFEGLLPPRAPKPVPVAAPEEPARPAKPPGPASGALARSGREDP